MCTRSGDRKCSRSAWLSSGNDLDQRDPAAAQPIRRVSPESLSAGRAGLLTTAGGLTFTGGDDGIFHAFETNTGKELWQFEAGASIWGAAPISFMLDGRQWVVTPSGVSLMAFAIPAATTQSVAGTSSVPVR